MAFVTIDGYAIDASLSEQHSFESEVTDFPIESGSSITDNVRPRPIKVMIDGIVSDTPLGKIADRRHVEVTAAGAFLPSDEALAVLLGIREAREPITIETSLQVFENMVMTNLDIPRDADTGHALKFTATFQQVKIVTNNRTTIRVASPNAARNVKKAQPPVVFIDNPDKRIAVVTKSGKGAVWNKEKGRYEYSTLYDKNGNLLGVTSPSGVPVPPSDIDRAATTAAQKAQDKTAKDALEATLQENSTYFDFQADEWRNTDGTPVTQEQLNSLKPRK